MTTSINYLAIALMTALCFSCTESTFDGLTFDEAIGETNDINSVDEINTPQETKSPEEIRGAEDICIVRSYKLAPGFSEFASLDPIQAL